MATDQQTTTLGPFVGFDDFAALAGRVSTAESRTTSLNLEPDVNTLVPSDVSAREWTYLTNPTRVRPGGNTGSNTYADGVHLNYLGDAPAGGNRSALFLAPAGVTAVALDVPAALPPGVANATVSLQVLKASDSSVVATLNQVLTSVLTTYTLTAAVTAGAEYVAVIYVQNGNTSAQAQAIIGRVAVRPTTGASGVLAGNFARVTVRPRVLHASNYPTDYRSGRYAFAGSMSYVELETDAISLIVEGVCSGSGGAQNWAVMVNGRLYASTTSIAADGTVKQVTQGLPTGAKLVRVVNLNQYSGGQGPANVKGSFLRAIYAPSGGLLRVVPPLYRDTLTIWGDSISQYNAPTSWPQLVRQRFEGVTVVEGWSGRSLYEEGQTTAARLTLARKLVHNRPRLLWMQVSTNDYGGNPWGAAAFGAAYADLLDQIHALSPGTLIYCQTPTVRGTETANGSGNTLADYRTQISSAAAARAGWTALVDGTQILALSDLNADLLHPTALGSAKYAEFVVAALGI